MWYSDPCKLNLKWTKRESPTNKKKSTKSFQAIHTTTMTNPNECSVIVNDHWNCAKILNKLKMKWKTPMMNYCKSLSKKLKVYNFLKMMHITSDLPHFRHTLKIFVLTFLHFSVSIISVFWFKYFFLFYLIF